MYGEGVKRRTRWNYFRDHLVDRFGETVYKVGVDAGFDCPNRDGTKAWGGCAYCSQQGSLSPHQDPKLGIVEQIAKGRAFVKRRYGARKNIVYFQAFTNTYAPVSVLRERFQLALVDEDVVGLSVATRPDCIDEEKAQCLAEFAAKVPLFTVELGLQSAFQNRLEWVNRQESVEDYVRAMEILRRYQIPVITHVIFGFPGESDDDMLSTVALADSEGTDGIKIQMLHVIRGTKLAVMYERNPFELLSMEHYGDLAIRAIEQLRPEVLIHRITGETIAKDLIAPNWVQQKTHFFDWFDQELERRDTWQGRLRGAARSGALAASLSQPSQK